ncbi:MAG: TonB-dependent receptor, partial [Bacteroidetes bacterium]
MRKAITIMWLLMGSLCYAQAQTITIKNKDTKQPIELVSLMSNNPKANTKTNAKGQADITAFKGAERIVLYALGYKTIAKSYAELEATPNEVLLEVSSIGLDEVVVSATRWGQTSRNVPSKITSISAKDVALQNPQTAADLLNVSGEVFIQKSQQGGGSPMIRGFSSNRLLYAVDGVRMNSAIFRAGNIQNVISLDAFAIENTEVFFGPGSIIYG